MINLVNPTLELFVYNMKKGGILDPQKDFNFYKYLVEYLPQQLPESLTKNPVTEDREYVQFLDVKNFEAGRFKFAGQFEEYSVEGAYHRFSLDDNYGLVFRISIDGKFNFNELARCLDKIRELAPTNLFLSGKLGQTWMLSGWVENGIKEDMETWASQAYKALVKQGWQYKETGQFLGGTVCELWRASSQRWEKVEADSHAVMILYPNQKAMTTASDFYEYWKSLFCYRNKIIWAYSQSRKLKERMLDEFNQMAPSIKNIYNLELGELKYALQSNAVALSEFVNNINYLEIQQNTIDVNLHHYEKSVELIQRQAEKVFQVSNDLKFLQEFRDIVKAKYQRQIEKDYASLRPCLDVLENLIETIRGIVEISQAESDRYFQTFVTVAGVGIGTAAIVSSSSSSWIAQVNQSTLVEAIARGLNIQESWTNFAIALSLSMTAGLLGCSLGFLFVRRFRLKRNNIQDDCSSN